MAGFRKPKADEMAPPGWRRGDRARRPADRSAGQSADECMATGQALVAGRPARRRGSRDWPCRRPTATCSASDSSLLNEARSRPQRTRRSGRHRVWCTGRRLEHHVARRGDRHPLPRRGRPQAQGDADRRRGRDGRALRRRPVAGAPADGRAGHRPEVRLEGVRREDRHVVHRADVPLDGRRRPARRPVRQRGRTRVRPPRRSPRSASTTAPRSSSS